MVGVLLGAYEDHRQFHLVDVGLFAFVIFALVQGRRYLIPTKNRTGAGSNHILNTTELYKGRPGGSRGNLRKF